MLIPLGWLKASRRAMRRHQGLPRGPRTPWRTLLWGEVVWAARQVRGCRWAVHGALAGFVASVAVLGSGAPGPTLAWQWRVLSAIGGAWAGGAAGRGLEVLRAARSSAERAGGRPLLGLAELGGMVVVGVLGVWLTVWAGALVQASG